MRQDLWNSKAHILLLKYLNKASPKLVFLKKYFVCKVFLKANEKVPPIKLLSFLYTRLLSMLQFSTKTALISYTYWKTGPQAAQC